MRTTSHAFMNDMTSAPAAPSPPPPECPQDDDASPGRLTLRGIPSNRWPAPEKDEAGSQASRGDFAGRAQITKGMEHLREFSRDLSAQ